MNRCYHWKETRKLDQQLCYSIQSSPAIAGARYYIDTHTHPRGRPRSSCDAIISRLGLGSHRGNSIPYRTNLQPGVECERKAMMKCKSSSVKFPGMHWLRVVPPSLSPSCVTWKKTAKKKWVRRNPKNASFLLHTCRPREEKMAAWNRGLVFTEEFDQISLGLARTIGFTSATVRIPSKDVHHPPLVTRETLNRFDQCFWFIRVVQRRQKSKPRGAAKVSFHNALSSWSAIVGYGGIQGPRRFFIIQHRWGFSKILLRRKASTRSCWR